MLFRGARGPQRGRGIEGYMRTHTGWVEPFTRTVGRPRGAAPILVRRGPFAERSTWKQRGREESDAAASCMLLAARCSLHCPTGHAPARRRIYADYVLRRTRSHELEGPPDSIRDT